MMTTEMRSMIEHEIGAAGRLAIQGRSGDLRIRGIAGTIARVAARDGDALDSLSVDRRDGALAVGSPGVTGLGIAAGRGASRDLDIEVPVGAEIVIETASGRIQAAGLAGAQRYRTTSGDVELRAVHGALDIEAVSGDVDIVADGPITLIGRTVSGDLALRAGPLTTAEIATTSGDVRLAARFDDPGPFVLETVSGDITLAAANDIRIEATTITGSLRSDRPARLVESPGQRTLIVGEGGPLIAFRSTSGDLRVVRAGAMPPTAPVAPIPAAPPVAPMPPIEIESASVDDDRLDVLRALEGGEIDVAEAERRLALIDDETGATDATGSTREEADRDD